MTRLTKWSDNPALRDDFERLNTLPMSFSDMIDDFFNRAMGRGADFFRPEMNVSESDDHFEITLEIPGVKKEDMEVSLEDNLLTIRGERRLEEEEKDRQYRHVESHYGTFERTLPLPETIDEESIEAKYENGVLTILIEKTEDNVSRKIDIK